MGESNAAVIVDSITKEWLGTVGGILAVLGVIAAPITSGDTAFRSARLIVADFLHKEQKSMVSRLVICIPLFIVAIGILLYSLKDKDGFDMIWRYFAWTNQTLAVFTLWALTVFPFSHPVIMIEISCGSRPDQSNNTFCDHRTKEDGTSHLFALDATGHQRTLCRMEPGNSSAGNTYKHDRENR